LGEILVQRDEKGRVVGLTMRDVPLETAAGTSVLHLLQAVATSLTDYLHVPVETSVANETYLLIDRSDLHLDRELDAILETLVIGLRMLEKEYSVELAVQEATVGVEV